MSAAWLQIEPLLPQLWRAVRAYEADPALQQDLMQEVLIAIWRSLPQLRERDRVAAFALRIAHNLGASHVRDALRAPARVALDETLPELSSTATPAPDDERRRWLLEAIRRLPLPQRQVLLLQLEGFEYHEIGEMLGLSVENVGVRAHRARRRLQEMHDEAG
jgi:RNA polymerase sigma factor (sigma-70 family)